MKKVQKVQGLFLSAKLADGSHVYNTFFMNIALKVLKPACTKEFYAYICSRFHAIVATERCNHSSSVQVALP